MEWAKAPALQPFVYREPTDRVIVVIEVQSYIPAFMHVYITCIHRYVHTCMNEFIQ